MLLLLTLACLNAYEPCLHFAQAAEPALASFLHTSVLVHPSLTKAMSFMLANKLSSRTLLGTQLMRLISDAYRADPVRCLPSVRAL